MKDKMIDKLNTKLLIVLTFLIFLTVIFCGGAPTEDELRSKAVKIISPRGMCSGEQVHAPSGANYILTAGHCDALIVDGSVTVVTEDGKTLTRQVIQEDANSDLLLIEGLPGVRGLDIASNWYHSEKVRTFTHGNNRATYKTEGELIEQDNIQVMLFGSIDPTEQLPPCDKPKERFLEGMTFFGPMRMCILQIDEILSSAAIRPGSSGGMVVNSSGELVGVASASGDGWNFFVSPHDINRFLNNY